MTFVASHAVVTALLLTLGILIPSMLFSGAGIFARWIRRSIDAADVSVAEAWLQVTAITDLRTWVIMWMSMLVVMGLIVLSARLLRNGFINAIFMGHMLRQGLPALAMAPSALARAAKTLGHDRH